MAIQTNPFEQAAKDLTEARKYLSDPKIWIKGSYRLRKQACALGGLSKVQSMSYNREAFQPHLNCAHKFLMDALPKGFGSVPHYNDHHSTTHGDVLALFDRAITAAQKASNEFKRSPKT